MQKRREIRNSTAEFLIFQVEGKEQGVEVYYKDKTVWCTQKAMGMLFDCSTDNIGLHLKNIFASGELIEEATAEKISVVRYEGNREVNRSLQFYNLDAVISVGYRVNSIRATQFRPKTRENFGQFGTDSCAILLHPCFLSAQSPRRTKRTQPWGIRKMQEVSADVSF